MTAMALVAAFRVVDLSPVLRVVHLRHAITIPLGGISVAEYVALPGDADSDLRDWDTPALAVKENGCSCIFAARTTTVPTG